MKKLILLLILIPLFSFSQNDLEINYVENRDNSVSFNYKKRIPGTYFLTLDFKNLRNTRAKNRQSKKITNNIGSLFNLRPNNDDEQIGFNYSYSYYKGNINSQVELNYPYIFPFKKDETIIPNELYEIENKYFNSKLPKGWKSYSFSFDEAQMVKSVRKGIVIEIKNNFVIDTLKKTDYYSDQNSIIIEHKDGTVATYKGFDKNKIKVYLGQTVYPQSNLGELARFDSRNLYRLYLSIFFYKTVKGKSLNNISSSNDYEIYYLTPKFFQNNNVIEIKSANKYKVDFNEKSLFKEMRKREIKKWKATKS